MIARPSSLRAMLSLSLALVVAGLACPRPAPAQATRPVAPPTTREKTEKAKREAAPQPGATVDLNSAPLDELTTLPGIGEAYARKIIDSRPHKSADDLAAHGIPARTIEGIKALTVVRPVPVAVDLNADPLVRVETLPGIGPALAQEIVAGRPYKDYEDLARIKGFGPAKIDSLRGRVKFGRAAAEPEPKAKTETRTERAKDERAEAKAKDERAEAKTRPAREAGLPGNKVNLNTASLEELDALPGIGMVRAQEIVDGRPYSRIEDIMKLKGIKEVEFGKVKDMITVGR